MSTPTGGSTEEDAIGNSRSRTGMWPWVVNRIAGVLTFFFLFAHVLDTTMLRVSPEAYDTVADIYKNPFVNLVEIGLVGAVLYHALYGLRIIAIDFWSRGAELQRQLRWLIVAIWIVVMVPSAFFMFQHSFETLFGSKS